MARWKSADPCIVTGTVPCEYHHLYSRGAHPELENKSWNKIPVIRKIHTEWHQKGAKYMAQKYPMILGWMLSNGWEIDPGTGKWFHPH